jgi:branched-chain amino acid aminotransferase
MAPLICYVNGNFVPLEEAYLPVQDLAILRGYGVFDFMRTYDGKPFKLHEHLLRLENSARLIQLDMPASVAEIEQIVHETLRRNSLPETNVRVVLTGGVSTDGITPISRPGLIVLVTPLHTYPAECYEKGIKVITVKIDRYLPDAKTINYIPAILALKKAKAAGALEALYLNQQGHILEGTTTNFFIFHSNQLITPQDGILPGLTRDVVLALAQRHFEVVEQAVTFEDVRQADEAFISASNKEIMPVHHVDDLMIGNGRPGPQTQLLMEQFHRFIREALS